MTFEKNDLETTTTNVADLDDDPLENNPASAHGHPVMENGENHDVEFSLALKKRGLEIRLQDGDGNCLFRAVSLQVYGDPSMHDDVRQQCLNFMVSVSFLVSHVFKNILLSNALLPVFRNVIKSISHNL